MPLASLPVQVGLLALLQALLLTNNVTLIAINGLAGARLAADPTYATLPVTGYVLGAAASSMLAARAMRLRGRRWGYTVGACFAIAGSLLAWWAVSAGSLPGLVAATFVSGIYNAFGASYRFAAADAADAWRPSFRARAISLVLAAGIVGGVVGPEVSKLTREALPSLFAGSYLALVGFAIASLVLAQGLRLPEQKASAATAQPARPLAAVLAQPTAWVAVLVASLAYGIMNLIMVATPLAMQVCSHPYAAAAFVLEWHVIGMFAPGLVTGSLIGRVGIVPVIVAGCVLMAGAILLALTGIEVWRFTLALGALGIGWNFMYTGATTLLTTCYRPSEKNRVQGFNDACVFATMVTSSFSSGALLHVQGWYTINALSLPFVLVALAATAWVARGSGWRVGRVA
ncbi:MAG TPA: MFS transporter [Burkholderiaceae bacterium]|nr:MFS transporter [Burkholderiaceae bacterium]